MKHYFHFEIYFRNEIKKGDISANVWKYGIKRGNNYEELCQLRIQSSLLLRIFKLNR